jgi:hypothetical protein
MYGLNATNVTSSYFYGNGTQLNGLCLSNGTFCTASSSFAYSNFFNQGLNTTSNVSHYNINSTLINSTLLNIRGQSTLGFENWTQLDYVTGTTYNKRQSLINAIGLGSLAIGHAHEYIITAGGAPIGYYVTYINATNRGSIAAGGYFNTGAQAYSILSNGVGSFAGGSPSAGNVVAYGDGSFTWGTSGINNHTAGMNVGQGNILNGTGKVAGIALGASNTIMESYCSSIGYSNICYTGATFGSANIGNANQMKASYSVNIGSQNSNTGGQSYVYLVGAYLIGLKSNSVMTGFGSNYFYADSTGLNLSNNTWASRNFTVQNTSFAGNFVLLNANFKDYEVALASVKAPASGTPAWTALLGSEVPAFSKSATNVLYFTGQINHDYKENTQVEFHIHLTHPRAVAGNSTWQFTYSWANITSTFPTQNTIKINCTSPTGATTVANRHDMCSFGMLAPTSANVSSVLLCSISRLGGDAGDNYDDVVYGVSADFHYQVDTMGSRTTTAK